MSTNITYYRPGEGDCVKVYEYDEMFYVSLDINRQPMVYESYATDEAAVKRAFEVAAKYHRPVRRYSIH